MQGRRKETRTKTVVDLTAIVLERTVSFNTCALMGLELGQNFGDDQILSCTESSDFFELVLRQELS